MNQPRAGPQLNQPLAVSQRQNQTQMDVRQNLTQRGLAQSEGQCSRFARAAAQGAGRHEAVGGHGRQCLSALHQTVCVRDASAGKNERI